MAELTAAALAQSLGGAKRDGASWRCLCPAHDDRDPSLSIAQKNGKLLVVCRAGCEQENVLAALRARGLWGKPADGTSRIVAAYSYRDEHGRLRYQSVRLNPKKFFQRRPNGAPDGFIKDLDGIEPLPYRLPELLADPMATVFVVEGEKDVDNLFEVGILSTCNHGGARKWKREISHWLAGRQVVIIPDNDETGRAHARDVAAQLKGIAATVRILEAARAAGQR